MSRFVIIALCFVVFIQAFQKTWIVTSWNINRDYIAANLCENKDIQNSTCSGSCYLKKQLKEQDKKEQQTPVSQKEKADFVCNALQSFSFLQVQKNNLDLLFPVVWEHGKPLHVGFSIFHPPSFIG